ncbi:hypothetical protein D3C72_1932340 [compost metagenome]
MQHIFIVIGFQQENIRMLDHMLHIFAGPSNIGQHTDIMNSIRDKETTGFFCIMVFGDPINFKPSYFNFLIGRNDIDQVGR